MIPSRAFANRTVAIAIEAAEQGIGVPVGKRIAWIVLRQLKTQRNGKVFGHLLTLDFAITVFVELFDCLPRTVHIIFWLAPPSERSRTGKQQSVALHRHLNCFGRKTADPPKLLAVRRIVRLETTRAERNNFVVRAVAPDHRRGPTRFE